MPNNTRPEEKHPQWYLAIRSFVRSNLAFLIPGWTLTKRAYWLIRYPTAKTRFEKIYHSNYWASEESFSGCGSNLEATRLLRAGLDAFIKEREITSMLDIPCGDFNWIRHMDLKLKYIGADIVAALISENQKAYGGENRSFEVLDLTKSKLPACDLVFTRDCLNHLSFSDIKKAQQNVSSSQSTYLAVTQFPEQATNRNQESGFIFRRINFRLPPFGWPEPLVEYPELENGIKTLAVWRVSDLPSN